MIEFDHVTKSYDSSGTPAVADFAHVFSTGTLSALVGTSGCGKTTLLRMVNRMVTPSQGRVLIDDTDISTLNPVPLRRSIGYVIQGSGLLPHRTVEDNILTVPHLTRNRSPYSLSELFEMVGLPEDLARRYPGELSGGQAQRVAVARALAHDPNILLLDEPFGALDPVIRRDLHAQLLGIQERLHKTILVVTHDMNEALALADEIVVLSLGGHIEQVGTPDDLVTHPATEQVRRFMGGDDRVVHIDGSLVRDGRGRVVGTLGTEPA